MKCTEFQHMMELFEAEEMDIADKTRLHTHLLGCPDCRSVHSLLQSEAELLKRAIAAPTLPDRFVDSILDQLEPLACDDDPSDSACASAQKSTSYAAESIAVDLPFEKELKVRPVRWKRLIGSSVAAVLLMGAVGMSVSPTFAAYVSSFVSRVGGELGLKLAAEQGYNTPVNKSVSDQGYTLRVTDIVADSARLVIAYMLEDATGKPLEDQYLPYFGDSKVYLTDKAGKMLGLPDDNQLGPDYGDFTFALASWPEEVIVHFEISSIGIRDPKKVNFNLQVPVNLRKSREAAAIFPINAVYESPQGIVFTFQQVMYAPSAIRFDIVTHYTDEAYEREKQKAKALDGKDDIAKDIQYRFSYRIVNKSGVVVARSGIDFDAAKEKMRTIYFSLDDSKSQTEAAKEKPGTEHWKTAIVPADRPEELTFILEEIEKKELAHFSIPFRSTAVNGAPVTKTYQETGDTYTIKGMKKGVDPQTKEAVWIIEIEGTLALWDMPGWNLTDTAGKRYQVTPDYATMTVRDSPQGKKLKQRLFVEGMSAPPEDLILTLRTYKKRYTDVNWQVPIPAHQVAENRMEESAR